MLGRFDRSVRLFMVVSALFGFTIFGGIYGLLLNLFLVRLGYGPAFVGLVNAGGNLALALFAIPAGALGNRWGSRRAIIRGLSLAVAGLGLLPAAEFVPGVMRDGWILVTYMAAWLGIALYFVNSNPFLMRVTTPVERNHAFSIQAALWPIAGFAGSLVGGLLPGWIARTLDTPLDNPAPYRYPLMIAAVLLIPAVIAMRATTEGTSSPLRQVEAKSGAPPRRLILMLALITLLQLAGEGAVRTFFNVYLDTALQVPTARIGMLSGLAQLLAVPAALATPTLAARIGNRDTVVVGSFGMALSMLPLAFIPHAAAASLGYVGLTAMASIRRPAISVYGMDIVPPSWRTTMSSATTMSLGASWCLIALAGGYLITRLSYPTFFLAAAIVTALGAILLRAAFHDVRG